MPTKPAGCLLQLCGALLFLGGLLGFCATGPSVGAGAGLIVGFALLAWGGLPSRIRP
jgi:hypothetical protein